MGQSFIQKSFQDFWRKTRAADRKFALAIFNSRMCCFWPKMIKMRNFAHFDHFRPKIFPT